MKYYLPGDGRTVFGSFSNCFRTLLWPFSIVFGSFSDHFAQFSHRFFPFFRVVAPRRCRGAIATPSAQAVAAATRDIPIVFSAVTDPVGAKLVSSMEKPGGNVTGVSDLSPMDEHLKLITRITPNVKRLGVIYNPGEAISCPLFTQNLERYLNSIS